MISPAEYLDIERKAEYKSEHFQGEMFALADVTPTHVLIVGNLVGELRQRLRGKRCSAYPADLRVHIPAADL